MEPAELARRIRAARGYAGLSRPKLVEKMGTGSKETLGRLERGERQAKDKIEALARACDLPYEFFTVDFARLPELVDDAPESHHIKAADQDISVENLVVLTREVHERLGQLERHVEELTKEREAAVKKIAELTGEEIKAPAGAAATPSADEDVAALEAELEDVERADRRARASEPTDERPRRQGQAG